MSAIRLSINKTNTFTLWGLAFHQVLKNGIIVSSRHWEISENGKNGASGHPERLKFRKTMFRDAPKLEKSEKQVFGESRNIFIT